MKAIRSLKHLLFYLPVLVLLVLNSCKHDNLEIVKENENIRAGADFVKNNYQLTLFSAAIEKAGMTEVLNGKGPFTLLAPTDAAFNAIGILRPSDFDKMNPDSLKLLVKSHVLDQRILQQDIPVNGVDVRYRTLAGTQVYCTLASYAGGDVTKPVNDLFYNGSTVTRKDVQLTNGCLQLLNKVMKYTPGTVQDWLSSHSNYSIFVSGLKKFGLWDKLAGAGPYTVIAPTNAAFATAKITAANIEALVPAQYYGDRLFGAYILNGKHFFISDIIALNTITNGGVYVKEVENDALFVNLIGLQDNDNSSMTYTMGLRTGRSTNSSAVGTAAGSKAIATLDYLTDNGLVHSSIRIMASLANAKKPITKN